MGTILHNVVQRVIFNQWIEKSKGDQVGSSGNILRMGTGSAKALRREQAGDF